MSVVSHLLVDTVDLSRLREQNTSPGAWSKDFVPTVTGVPFRIASLGANEQRIAEQMKVYATHAGFLEADVDLARDDVVTLLLRSGVAVAPARVYRVVATQLPSLPYFNKVLLQEIQEATV